MREEKNRIDGVQLALDFDLEYFTGCAEAALFACGSAMAFDKLAEAIVAEEKHIPYILQNLKEKYDRASGAIELVVMDKYAQFCTKGVYADVVRRALEIRKNQPLSKAALEVLAIIAYNQPTTRAFVEKVRGVESPSVVATLAEKGLIEECGRLDAPGRPVLYATTPVFLRTFGLSSVEELGPAPDVEGIDALLGKGELGMLAASGMSENQLTFDSMVDMETDGVKVVSPDDNDDEENTEFLSGSPDPFREEENEEEDAEESRAETEKPSADGAEE